MEDNSGTRTENERRGEESNAPLDKRREAAMELEMRLKKTEMTVVSERWR